jgi:thiosulfate/3-mercaptopyruvate sulfurtransferase
MNTSIVSAHWLLENSNLPNLVILDASMPKPGAKPEPPENRQKIKNARFFDIEGTFSDKNSPLPHTLPSPQTFTQEAQKLGINQDSTVVVYDSTGIYSAPRAWFMLKGMGHANAYVLDGGLPAWVQAGGEIVPFLTEENFTKGNFVAHYQAAMFCDSQYVLAAIEDKAQLVIDARSEERFLGKVEEPRAGLRRGHIPNAANIPFTKVQSNNKMLETSELQMLFEQVANKDQTLVFSCGSGVTACVVALGANLAGYTKLKIYDGSWSEWGQPSNLPVSV